MDQPRATALCVHDDPGHRSPSTNVSSTPVPPPSTSAGSGSSGNSNGNNGTTPLKKLQLINCSCPSTVNTTSESVKYSQCPVCLMKFEGCKTPIGLRCGHTICLSCVRILIPGAYNGNLNPPPNLEALDVTVGLPNVALMTYLDCPVDPLFPGRLKLEQDCVGVLCRFVDIALLIKSHIVSRAIYRKIMNLLMSINPIGQLRILKSTKAIAERCLVELTSSCSHLSHYHAQQQLWTAIRGRACQFMGPAMQEEALKLVLLALEDGSALSRKVLVMFVVQRLAPQFPQASKTSVGHIVQLLYRASTFEVIKRPENSSLMTLRPEFRNYESLRREHDTQIMKIGLEAGIRFTPEQWSSLLYGDTTHKPLMQSIIDKLQAPQTFADLLKEFLVCVQRLNDDEDTTRALLSLYPYFQNLGNIDIQRYTTPTGEIMFPSWTEVDCYLQNLYSVLEGLVSFEKPQTRRRYKETPVVRMMQQVSL